MTKITSTMLPTGPHNVLAQKLEIAGHDFICLSVEGSPREFVLDMTEERLLALPQWNGEKAVGGESANEYDAAIVRACIASMLSEAIQKSGA